MSKNIVEEIIFLLTQHGGSQYGGEPVTQGEHALQAANLFEQAAQQKKNQKLITVLCDEGDIEFVRQRTLEFEHNEEK
jgi:predicted HD phosphohydrolase